MTTPTLPDLLRQMFPDADFDATDPGLAVGAFAAWDSLAHFNLLLLVEEAYDVRFSVEEMTALKSVAAIAAILAERGAG